MPKTTSSSSRDSPRSSPQASPLASPREDSSQKGAPGVVGEQASSSAPPAAGRAYAREMELHFPRSKRGGIQKVRIRGASSRSSCSVADALGLVRTSEEDEEGDADDAERAAHDALGEAMECCDLQGVSPAPWAEDVDFEDLWRACRRVRNKRSFLERIFDPKYVREMMDHCSGGDDESQGFT